MKILNNKNTYFNGGKTSDLDIQMSNRPQKIKNYFQIDDTESDHALLILKRNMKIVPEEQQYMNVSNIKNIDSSIYNDKIINHKLYYSTLTETDSSIITNNIIKIMTDVNNDLCPMKKKLMKPNLEKVNTKITKMIEDRRNAYITMKNEKTTENIMNYKDLKHIVQKEIRN